MALTGIIKEIIDEKADDIAQNILVDLMDACPVRTGKTAESFEIHKIGHKYYIGSTRLSAFYADYGNGGPGRIIRSTRRMDRRGRIPAKLKLSDGTYRVYVHGYEGSHFVKAVADKYK